MGIREEKQFGQSSPALLQWAEALFQPVDAGLAEVVRRSDEGGLPSIAVAPFDGLLLEVLTRALQPRRVVEVGTLGGYSGLCLLRGMPAGGILDTCEYSEKHAAVARATFSRHGFADRARVHVGPASESLRRLGAEGPFDLVFIDADKPGYPDYLAWAEENLRLGGVVLGDNAFGWGGVARPPEGPDADKIRGLVEFNRRLATGGRFRATMIPTGEGLAMGVKIR